MITIGKRLTYEEVKEFIEILSESGYKLISDEYNGAKSKIKIQCDNDHIYEVLFYNFKIGHRCPHCVGLAPFKYDDVKNYIESFGYKLLSTEYKNINSDIEIKCSEGHKYTGTFKRFKIGRRCPICNGGIRKHGKEVYDEFISKGVIPKFNPEEYQNNHQRLFFLCAEHSNEGVQVTTYNNSQRSPYICHFCNIEKCRSRESHYNWKGGISHINEYLRERIDTWKKESFDKHQYRCDITGLTNDLVIHHVNKNFSDIVEETFKIAEIDIKSELINYTRMELDLLTKICVDLHFKYGLGVCLNGDIHKLFHKIYGKNKNNLNQYIEFRENYLNGLYQSTKEGVII